MRTLSDHHGDGEIRYSHRPEMAILYGAEKMRFAWQITKAKKETHSELLLHGDKIMRARLNVTLYVHCLPS